MASFSTGTLFHSTGYLGQFSTNNLFNTVGFHGQFLNRDPIPSIWRYWPAFPYGPYSTQWVILVSSSIGTLFRPVGYLGHREPIPSRWLSWPTFP